MIHLSFEEISSFVSMDGLTMENRELATRVLTHIRCCDKCREAVGGMLDVTDVLLSAKRSLVSEHSKER